MRPVTADIASCLYDDATDVFYVPLGRSRFTDEEEVGPGIHVLYEFDGERTDKVVGVEIEYFKERFSDLPASIEIDAEHPFTLIIPSL